MTGVSGSDRAGVELLLWLLDEAFERSEHSLLANVATFPDEHWARVPEGAGRTVGAILGHVGGAKYMYENFAFGDGAFEAGKPPVVPPLGRDPLIEWLREGQRRFVTSLGALSDRQLEAQRLTPWRGQLAVREIARVIIEHDLYHAGEVNHLRALLDGSDRWPWE